MENVKAPQAIAQVCRDMMMVYQGSRFNWKVVLGNMGRRYKLYTLDEVPWMLPELEIKTGDSYMKQNVGRIYYIN